MHDSAIQTEHSTIGNDSLPYCIAEIGLNHNGSLETAKRMVAAAAQAGARGAKFQIWQSDSFIAASAVLGAGPPDSLRDFFRQFELCEHDWEALAAECRSLGIDFLASTFDLPSLKLYLSLAPSLIKIASGDLLFRTLQREAAASGLPILQATGAAAAAEVESSIEALYHSGASRVVPLQCVSAYPARSEDANLSLLPLWRRRWGLVGFSDHNLDNRVAFGAVALGAAVIEKHFTLDRALPGPDQALSQEPHGFAELVAGCNELFSALGDGVKRVMPFEEPVRRGGYRSLYAPPDAARRGSRLDEVEWLELRPFVEGGLSTLERDRFAARRLKRDLLPGEALRIEDLESEG